MERNDRSMENKTPESTLFRTRLTILSAVGLLSIILIVCMALWGFRSRPEEPAPASSVTEQTILPTAVARVLGEWNGKLALFVGGNPVPDEVFDVYLVSLPEEEQERLTAGIPVADETELARLLEDYTS